MPLAWPAASSARPDAPGTQLWAKRYNGPAGQSDGPFALAVGGDGERVFATGGSFDPGTGYDYATVAYDSATGGRLWTARYDGPGGSYDSARAAAASPDGATVFVTGSSIGLDGGQDYATIAYDALTGDERWIQRYSGSGDVNASAAAMAVNAAGTVLFVTGAASGPRDYDFVTIAYGTSTGRRLWKERYNGSGSSYDLARSLTTAGGAVFVTGSTLSNRAGNNYATVAYDAATGEQLWASSYDGPAHDADVALSVASNPEGTAVFVTGESFGGRVTFTDYATIAYDAATGAALWVRRYHSGYGTGDFGQAVGVSPAGTTVYATGYSYGSEGDLDYATVAYDAATGADRWLSRYDGTGADSDYASAMAVPAAGDAVFVTGVSLGTGTDADYATVAYDAATGAERWVSRYDGPPHDYDSASAIGATPDGTRVFVTGISDSSPTGSDYDYATVAYEA